MGFEDSGHVAQGFGRAQVNDARGDAVGDSNAFPG
jgi:hypothetical protein